LLRHSQKKRIMKASLLVLTFLCAGLLSYAQYYELPEEETTPLLTLAEINFSGSNWSVRPATEGLNDFRKLAPGSQLLDINLEGYEFSPFGMFVSNTSVNFNLGFNIRSNWKEKYGQRLRIGFSSAQAELFAGAYSRSDRFPYDTLVSPTTGNIEVLDSVQMQYLSLSYATRALLLDASYLVVLNPNNRWSFYTGFGLGVGLTINAETTLQYTRRMTTEEDDYLVYMNSNYNDIEERRTEVFRNKRSLALTASIPFGVDFRIGKKRQFWMPVHLFYEMQPTLRLNHVPEVGMISHLPLAQNFGLRVTI
jgi:hypothetical protein